MIKCTESLKMCLLHPKMFVSKFMCPACRLTTCRMFWCSYNSQRWQCLSLHLAGFLHRLPSIDNSNLGFYSHSNQIYCTEEMHMTWYIFSRQETYCLGQKVQFLVKMLWLYTKYLILDVMNNIDKHSYLLNCIFLLAWEILSGHNEECINMRLMWICWML